MDKHRIKLQRGGFTLIELIVAVGVFSIIATIATSAIILSLRASRKIRATQTVMNNLGFALESMTRSIRVGTDYHCDATVLPVITPRDCANVSASSFAFEPSGGGPRVVYRLNGTTIERSKNDGVAGTFIPMTAPEVVVERLQFFVNNSQRPPDRNQPFVIMTIEGYAAPDAQTRTDFHIQTTVAQRIRDQIP